MQTKIDLGEPFSALKRKRKKEKIKKNEEEESNLSNKKKKVEILNNLTFYPKTQNNLYNTFSSKIDSYLVNRKIYTTSSNNKHTYFCQKLTSSKTNPIQIIDAKILILKDKTLLFLISSNMLYLFQIEENKYYNLIKQIPLDPQNSFIFSYLPKNIYIITPKEKKSKKAEMAQNNNKKVKTRMKLYLCIVSCIEKYLCQFDLKNLVFKKVKKIMPKKVLPQYLVSQEMKYKLYQNNKILSYYERGAYVQKLYGKQKFKNLKIKGIESVSLLNENLFSICTPNRIYIYDTYNEGVLGDFETFSTNKKAKLMKPDNNILMAYSKDDISFYDLESLKFFQKLDLNDIIKDSSETIKKVKQLNNNNIAILFHYTFAIFNLEKNIITCKFNYWSDKNSLNDNNILMEINPNVVFINNDGETIYLINSINADKIATFDGNITLCKKIKKYVFKYGVTPDKSIELEETNEKNSKFVLINSDQNTYILNSIAEE